MKTQCPLCKEIVALSDVTFQRGDAVSVRCGRCGGAFETRLPSAHFPLPGLMATAATAPEDDCPECGAAVRAGETGCAVCGLPRTQFANFRTTLGEAIPSLLAAWDRLEGVWEDADEHQAFAERVAEVGAWGFAISGYRWRPRRDRQGREGTARLIRMAYALASSRLGRAAKP